MRALSSAEVAKTGVVPMPQPGERLPWVGMRSWLWDMMIPECVVGEELLGHDLGNWGVFLDAVRVFYQSELE